MPKTKSILSSLVGKLKTKVDKEAKWILAFISVRGSFNSSDWCITGTFNFTKLIFILRPTLVKADMDFQSNAYLILVKYLL